MILQPATIERAAPIPSGAMFRFGRLMLRVVRCYGEDPAAPVIVLEPSGQYALWAYRGVARIMAGQKPARIS